MRKIVSLFLVLVFAAVSLAPRPVRAATGSGSEQGGTQGDIRIEETGPFGRVKFIYSPPKGSRSYVVPVYEYMSWDEMQKRNPGGVYRTFTSAPRGVEDSYRDAGGLIRMARMAAGNWDLFKRGFMDVWHAVNESADFYKKGMANANDPEKRYDFWKSKGIYDKYNAGERAFLNQVVMPAVAVAQWTVTGLGGVGSGVTAAAGLALGVAVLTGGAGLALAGVIFGAGALAGALLAVAETHYKGNRVHEAGGDINALHGHIGFNWHNPFPIGDLPEEPLGLVDVTVNWNGLYPKLLSAEIAVSSLTGAGAGGFATYLKGEQEYNTLATYNAYGIPEVVEVRTPPVVEKWFDTPREQGNNVWKLVYSLCK